MKRNNNSNSNSLIIEDANSSASNYSMTAVAGDNQTVAVLYVFPWSTWVHRFYLGDTVIGVIQLLTLGGLGVWVFIDFIRLLIGDLGPGW